MSKRCARSTEVLVSIICKNRDWRHNLLLTLNNAQLPSPKELIPHRPTPQEPHLLSSLRKARRQKLTRAYSQSVNRGGSVAKSICTMWPASPAWSADGHPLTPIT